MRLSRFQFRRILGTALVCLLFLPRLAAAADTLLQVDLDGDGQRDRVATLRRGVPTLQIWLSATNTTQLIRTGAPVQRLLAADIDGDRRIELIASDAQWRVHVWTAKHRKLKPYRLGHVSPFGLQAQPRHRVDDTDSEAPEALRGTRGASSDNVLLPLVRAPSAAPSSSFTTLARVARCVDGGVNSLLPRPPPVILSL